MEWIFSDSLIPRLFPKPDDVVTRKVTVCQRAKSKLTPRAKYLLGVARLLLGLIIVGLFIEFCIGFIFNDRLVSGNVADELSTSDQILRGAGAMGMVVVIMGVVFGIHVAFKPTVATPYRVAAALASIGIGVGIYLVAASIGHQVFASVFDKLWGGNAALNVVLDPNQSIQGPNAANQDQMPFGLKLIASSALFLGVAFFVALCELFWLHTRDRLAHVRELIAEADLIISKYAEADEAKVQAIQAEQQFRMTQDEDYKRTFAHAKLVEAEQGWRNSIEGQRPDTTNIAKLPPEQYQRRKVFTGKIEAAVIAVDAMKKNQGQQVQDLIERFMAKPASKKLKPESVNQTQAPQNKG